MEKINEKIFKNIEAVRVCKNITQEELAVKAGLRNSKRYATILRSKSCHLRELCSICVALDVSVDEVVRKTVQTSFKFIHDEDIQWADKNS